MSNKERTARFRALHAPGGILVLPNAWDAGSARLMEVAGAKAIATSSAAVSWAHGSADGQTIAPETLLRTVAEIVRVTAVPVSVDAEAGLDKTPQGVAAFVMRLCEAGASGINLEDGTDSPDLLAAKIAAIKQAARQAGTDIFINARCDVYLRKLADGDAALAEVLRRGALYRDAGADGLFVPGVADAAVISQIAQTIDLPLNVLVWPGLPAVSALKAAGVRRVSAGAGIARAALGAALRAAHQMLREGRYETIAQEADGLPNMNGLFIAP
ncbi:MAG: isocitrate lyase/phosphoenolpyruvate mutase family protein [Alphaproteobacteria bacterium]|nr:isocitrate lyase/phosphoenolpyruvate mutase family protein [Alphaproteobacteria bacterium]